MVDACTCTEHIETFWSLFTSLPHWGLELSIEAISGLVGVAVWPTIKNVWMRRFHRHDTCCSTKVDP